MATEEKAGQVTTGSASGSDRSGSSAIRSTGHEGTGEDRSFSQRELDTILAKEKRQIQQKHLEETEDILKSKGLTEQEREKLAKRKDELEVALMSEKDRARAEREKLEKEYGEKIKVHEEQVKTWQSRFSSATIRRSISDAAVLADAHDPMQFVDLLESKIRLQEELGEDAQPTGQFEAVIDIHEKDEKTGKTKKHTMSVEKYITEVMAESPRYKNLFDSGRVGGTGRRAGSSVGGEGGTLSSMQKISRGLSELRR